jgi:hypothetical protein
MTPLRCRGCRRQLGVAADVHNGVYCSEMCATDTPAGVNQDRDDLIQLLAATGTPRTTIISEFGITKQRLSQVLSKRTGIAA